MRVRQEFGKQSSPSGSLRNDMPPVNVPGAQTHEVGHQLGRVLSKPKKTRAASANTYKFQREAVDWNPSCVYALREEQNYELPISRNLETIKQVHRFRNS